jgi:hypothetical protein
MTILKKDGFATRFGLMDDLDDALLNRRKLPFPRDLGGQKSSVGAFR